MANLKDLAKDIKVQWNRVGFNPHTEQTNWIAVINFQTFEFHCGLFACIPEKIEKPSLGGRIVNPLRELERHFKMPSIYWHNEENIFARIRQGQVKAAKNLNDEHVMNVFHRIAGLCQPTAYDLLYSLQSDSRAETMSFKDFASEFGYSDDSISALNTYNACCENAKKLRTALGNELYKKVMEAEPE